jgi:hypothetical protein
MRRVLHGSVRGRWPAGHVAGHTTMSKGLARNHSPSHAHAQAAELQPKPYPCTDGRTTAQAIPMHRRQNYSPSHTHAQTAEPQPKPYPCTRGTHPPHPRTADLEDACVGQADGQRVVQQRQRRVIQGRRREADAVWEAAQALDVLRVCVCAGAAAARNVCGHTTRLGLVRPQVAQLTLNVYACVDPAPRRAPAAKAGEREVANTHLLAEELEQAHGHQPLCGVRQQQAVPAGGVVGREQPQAADARVCELHLTQCVCVCVCTCARV